MKSTSPFPNFSSSSLSSPPIPRYPKILLKSHLKGILVYSSILLSHPPNKYWILLNKCYASEWIQKSPGEWVGGIKSIVRSTRIYRRLEGGKFNSRQRDFISIQCTLSIVLPFRPPTAHHFHNNFTTNAVHRGGARLSIWLWKHPHPNMFKGGGCVSDGGTGLPPSNAFIGKMKNEFVWRGNNFWRQPIEDDKPYRVLNSRGGSTDGDGGDGLRAIDFSGGEVGVPISHSHTLTPPKGP